MKTLKISKKCPVNTFFQQTQLRKKVSKQKTIITIFVGDCTLV